MKATLGAEVSNATAASRAQSRLKLAPRQHPLLHLQRTIGNQAVQRALQAHGAETATVTATARSALASLPESSRVSAPDIALRLPIGQVGDEREQEAERISEHVMNTPQRDGAGGMSPGYERPSVRSVGPMRVERMTAAGLGQLSAPDVADEIASSSGQPLDAATRNFMEPRFGRSFGQVRIHADRAAPSASQGLGAVAVILGSNMFFNSGRYQPNRPVGLGLVAHELTHGMQQQSANDPGPVIQRATIDYRQITWADFQGTPPQGKADTDPAVGAVTDSHFDAASSYDPKSTAVDKGTGCRIDKRAATIFEATYGPDPDDMQKPKAIMVQETSWARARITGDATAFCRGKSNDDEGFRRCMGDQVTERARLLKHEQGHFDITNVVAKNARASLQALNRTFTATGCGNDAARDAARPLYVNDLQPKLATLRRDWGVVERQAQTDYDNDTKKGSVAAQQATWERLIKDGLTRYRPSSAAAPATTTPATPPTTPPSQAQSPPPRREPPAPRH